MRAFILLFILGVAGFCVSGQTADTIMTNTSCHASFLANPDPLNPMTIHFQDQSSGQITHWQWSFGDGSTTTLQNPVHTYAAGGTYFVCLTVSNSDSGNMCHDVSCVAITIHEPGACVADYQYAVDSVNRLKARFTDHSTGNINAWHWVFGDGGSSSERNPTHIFSTYGKFRVCLTAYNTDSVSTCNDTRCDSVEVSPAPECHALFSSSLDTLNPVPNTFRFKNSSTGSPNKYLWKFDDGSFSDSRDAVHHFQTAGQHQVCLVIKKVEHGNTICADSICQTITTAKYFDLGGHLFTGEFPINNPVSTGDTGVAYLLRVDGTKLIPFDTNRFTRLGYYTFPNTLNGSYIVKAMLTPGSDNHDRYFPAYTLNALTWKEAIPIDLSANNAFASDIHLVRVDEVLNGTGVAKGRVEYANSKSSPEVVPFAEVILFDDGLKPLLYASSGPDGRFEIRNIPFGAYYAYVEFPGRYSRMTAIWLDASRPVADDLLLEVYDHDVTSVPGISSIPLLIGEPFPNPATSEVNVTVETPNAMPVKFEIMTLAGQITWSGSYNCHAGLNLVTIPVKQAGAGLYLFRIKTIDGIQIAIKKLVKY